MPTRIVRGLALLTFLVVTAAGGAAAAQPARVAAVLPPEPERRSPGMMVTGIVFTSLGAVTATGGGVVTIGSLTGCNSEYCGVFALMGGAITLSGQIFLSIGIPLWISGGSRVSPGAEATNRYAPAIAITPRSATARWSF